MKKIKITFEIAPPGEEITDAQLAEWLAHKLGGSPSISADNPLARTPVLAVGKIKIEPAEPPADARMPRVLKAAAKSEGKAPELADPE